MCIRVGLIWGDFSGSPVGINCQSLRVDTNKRIISVLSIEGTALFIPAMNW